MNATEKSKFISITKKFRRDFIAGMAIIFPVLATILILKYLIVTTNNILLAPLTKFLEPNLGTLALILAKFLIFIGVIFSVILIGAGTRVLLLRKLFSIGEGLLYKMPFVNKIYRPIKQTINTFMEGGGRELFKSVVLVQYPRKGIYSIGFVTNTRNEEINKKTGASTISIFVPTTPSPATGWVIMVPKEEVIFLDTSIEDAMKIIISGGLVGPEGWQDKNKKIES